MTALGEAKVDEYPFRLPAKAGTSEDEHGTMAGSGTGRPGGTCRP